MFNTLRIRTSRLRGGTSIFEMNHRVNVLVRVWRGRQNWRGLSHTPPVPCRKASACTRASVSKVRIHICGSTRNGSLLSRSASLIARHAPKRRDVPRLCMMLHRTSRGTRPTRRCCVVSTQPPGRQTVDVKKREHKSLD